MWTRVALAAGCFASIMGFARLAYGLLIPAMRHALGGDLSTYGLIGTGNFVGYLIGALGATQLAKRDDRARVDLLFLLATAALLVGTGFAPSTLVLAIVRFLVGIASGVALTLTIALATEPVPADRRGLAAAIIWGGGAAGVAFVGLASLLIRPDDAAGWRIQWIAMGIAGAAVAVAFGRTVGADFTRTERHDDGAPIGLWLRPRYLALTLAYFAFGFGYIDILTFLGAALSRATGVSSGVVWAVLGTAGAVGAALWGPLLDRMRSGVPIALAASCCAGGAVMIATERPALALAGAFLIGVSFIGVPAMVGALVQQREGPGRYPRAFASITTVLGAGQILGPLVGGRLADAAGATAALVLGAAVLAVAAACALGYRRPSLAGLE